MKNYDTKIYLVFDKVCTDGSYELSKALEKKYSNLKTTFCNDSSCPTDSYLFGFQHALNDGCEWIIDINGGFRHEPSEIIRFIEQSNNDTKFILGSRFILDSELKNQIAIFNEKRKKIELFEEEEKERKNPCAKSSIINKRCQRFNFSVYL